MCRAFSWNSGDEVWIELVRTGIGFLATQVDSLKSSRPMSMRRISDVPAPIS